MLCAVLATVEVIWSSGGLICHHLHQSFPCRHCPLPWHGVQGLRTRGKGRAHTLKVGTLYGVHEYQISSLPLCYFFNLPFSLLSSSHSLSPSLLSSLLLSPFSLYLSPSLPLPPLSPLSLFLPLSPSPPSLSISPSPLSLPSLSPFLPPPSLSG